MRKRILPLLLFILLYGHINAQEKNEKYTIQIIDNKTFEPLPFATILININRHEGTVTNLNGWANLNLSSKDSCLQISYVGYKSKIVNKKNLSKIIRLEPFEVTGGEVVVYSTENPAHRIIKKAVKNRQINNPEKITEYGCDIYNKIIFDYLFNDEFAKKDTLNRIFMAFFEDNHAMFMESATERYYKSPDKIFEKVKKVKVSGFKDPSFAPLSTEMQPFHFYDPLIDLVDIKFLNPISQGSHKKYVFIIEDTIYNKSDTTFIISYQPKRKSNFQGLKGFLHINTNKYAIENVVASPAGNQLIGTFIQQKYEFVNKHWFPKELKSEVRWENLYKVGMGISIKSESYIDNFRTNVPKDSIKYSEEVLVFDKLATLDAKTEMSKYRNTSLSLKEQNTYIAVDSLGEKHNFDRILRVAEKLIDGKLPLKKFFIPLNKLFTFNDFEGTRIGFGLYTDVKLINWLKIGGWGAYGFRDKQWKYGGGITIYFDHKHETAISGEYSYDAVFPGYQNFISGKMYQESYLLKLADYSTQMKVSFETRLKYLQFQVDLLNDERIPQYDYSFLLDKNWANKFETTELGVRLRFAFKEKYLWQLKKKIAFESKWPVLTVGYKKGLKNFFGGNFNYDKLTLQFDYSYHFARLGKTSIKLKAGKIWGVIPFSFLFEGDGGWSKSLAVYFENRFNSMASNEFTNDEIASIFLSHNFGTRLISTAKWKPKIVITQAIAYGNLTNKSLHKGIELKEMSKGYFENGLIIKDIYRINVGNSFYFGVGAGAFYNYGYYSSTQQKDNFNFKYVINISF